MKQFWDMIEIKGIPIWKALMILDIHGFYTMMILDKEIGKIMQAHNRKAIEQALIELHYTV